MRLGALLGPVDDAAGPEFIAEQARMYEGEGFDSLWAAQAIGRGFMHMDPFITLSVAAAVTGLEIGTAVVQLPLYHPVDFAHRVFSLMQISGSRLTLGIGAGSTETDFAALGLDHSRRFSDFDVKTEQLRRLFREGGDDTVDLSPWASVQGGPPLFFGTWGKGVERAAESFDGWIASGHYRTPDEVIAALLRYRKAGGGRAIVSTLLLGSDTDMLEAGDKLARFSEAGFDDAVVMCMPGGPSPAEIRSMVG